MPVRAEFRPHGLVPWEPAPGLGTSAMQKVLLREDSLNIAVRLLRCDPGFEGGISLVHDVDEFAFVLAGQASDVATGGVYCREGMFCHVPAGVHHGPFATGSGVTMLEVRYPIPPSR